MKESSEEKIALKGIILCSILEILGLLFLHLINP